MEVVGSHTGSGKTLAYLLPLAQLLRRDEELHGMLMNPRRPAVVLCATRELCEQAWTTVVPLYQLINPQAMQGIARGSGWQHIEAYINHEEYYLVGIPVSLLSGFLLHLRGKGLWGVLVAGATVQSLMLANVTFRTDWAKLAMEARQRIFEGKDRSSCEAI